MNQERFRVVLLCLAVGAGLWKCPLGSPIQRVHADDSKSSIYLSGPQRLETRFQGEDALVRPLNSGQATPLSLAADDFDADGINDLAVGYATPDGGRIAIFRGNLDAFAPQSQQSFEAIGRSEFPSPFLSAAQVVALPIAPDFLAAGMFIGHDGPALVAAARGGHAIYVLARDTYGNFQVLQTIPVEGSITVLQAFKLVPGQYVQVVAGIHGADKPSLLVYTGSNEGLSQSTSFPLSGDATALASGNLDDDTVPDLLVVAGGQASILHGASQTFEPLHLQFTVTAAALGNFIFDRDSLAQMALLGTNGDLHLLVQDSIDQRPFTAEEIGSRRASRRGFDGVARPQSPDQRTVLWKEIESYSLAGVPDPAGRAPVMFRTRISSNGADDVMFLTSARLFVLAHTDLNPSSGVLIARDDLAADAAAALVVRVNVDGRPGVVFLKRGDMAPQVMMPLPDPTIFVNRIDDPTPDAQSGANTCTNTSFADTSVSCSLREAVLKAVADAGPDTIMLQGLTYSLTIGRPASPDYTGHAGALYVNNSMNIVGAAQNSTIIQWGIPATGTLDMVIAVNEDIAPITNATASISNLTIQNGVNHGAHGTDGDGGCMEYDTGSSGTADLNLTNVTIQNCATTKGNGAGIVIFNSVVQPHGGAGKATITNCIIQNNSAVDSVASGAGGGVGESEPAHMVISNSQILNNKATQVNGQTGVGGGLALVANASIGDATIHSTTISGNKSAGVGGGIYNTLTLAMDQGSIISGNIAGTNGTNPIAGVDGGGLDISTIATGCPSACSVPTTLTKVTITGNTATGNGGGISTGSNSGDGPLTMSFSRLAGNSATAGSNLQNNSTTAMVTNNWWGTNAASSTIHNLNTANTTFDPFIVLTHTASPQKIRINQSTTLTGDMSNDNHGNAVGLANLTEIIGLPITFDAAVLGTIPQAQPETLNGSAQATATFNAGGTSGLGSANATVDQAVVPVNSNLIASATESGTTVTITTVGIHGYSAGEFVSISGVGVGGYNGNFFKILATPTTTSFTYTTTGGLGNSSGGTANAGILILKPPTMTKSFNPTAVAKNTPSTLTFSITNGNVVPIDGSFVDNLPANLVVAATPNVVNNCGGSVTAAAAATHIDFANAASPAGTCTISVDVQSAIDNTYNNSVTLQSADAGAATLASTASLTVINPPTIAKLFGAATIPLNGTTSLSVTLTSTNVNLTLTGVAFTDSLTSGLIVATPGNLNSTCNGTATAADGSSSVSLSGASLAPGASCTVTVTVKGSTAGVKANSVQGMSANGGSGNTSTVNITVVAPPTISKSFLASSVPLNGTTTVTFTITNPNATAALNGVNFSDTLVAGLVVASTPNVMNTCNGTPSASGSTISLSAGIVPNFTNCTLKVDVTGTTAGDKPNTTTAIGSTEGGTGVASNTATLTVVAPPTIAKAFGVTFLGLNQTTTVTFTITNPAANTVSQTGLAFSDTLPSGLVVANPPVPSGCSGTVTAADAGNSIVLANGTVGTNTNCTVTVTVKGTTTGVKNNTTGAVSSANGGTGVASNTATVTVASPPTIAKAFSPTQIPLNGTSTATFTISNPNGITLNGVTFSDTLLGGLLVASPPNVLTSGCGGSANVTAAGGNTTISLAGGIIAGNGTCTVNVDVKGTVFGVKPNTTGAPSSTEGGTGVASNTANLTVVAPPGITKGFSLSSIPLNGTTTITFTIANPNTVGLTNITFADTLPAGLVVANPANAGAGTCTATFAPNPGDTSLTVSGIALGASLNCTVKVDVKGTASGNQANTTGKISSTESGTGAVSNTATVNVVAPPTIAKAFGAANIGLNGTTSLTFTITNPAANTVSETGVAFSDTLPSGLTTPNNAGSTVCGTGTVVITGNNAIAVSGGTVAVNTPCSIVLIVTGTTEGLKSNTTGVVSSTNGGTGAVSNTATVSVASPPTISKGFNPTQIPLGANTTLTFSIANPNSVATLNGISFNDLLPAGLVVANPNGLSNNGCGGSALAGVGGSSVSLSAGTLTAGAMCTVVVNLTGTTAGVKNNSVTVNSTEGGLGNTSNASVTVVAPPMIGKAFLPLSIPLNGTSTITFTIMNPNGVGLTGIAFNDTLPAGLVVANPPNAGAGTCTATFTPNSGDTSLAVSSIALAAAQNCTVKVDVKGTAAGNQNNNTGPINSVEGGMGSGSNTATVNVVAPPTIAKAFGAANIPLNGTTSLTFTITNPAANTVSETGVAFTDMLPTGLTTANNAGSTVCGTGTVVITGNNAISLTGGTVGVNTNCTIVLTVTGTSEGLKSNTTGPISSTNGGTGVASNTATVSVASPPTISKGFNPTQIPLGTNTTLTFTITNPNSVSTLNGISFNDLLPAGLVVANPNGLSNNGCGGSALAGVGGSSVSLSVGTLTAGAMCTVVVNLTGTTAGVKNNSVTVNSTEGGLGNTFNASVTVVAPPMIGKAFLPLSIPLNGTSTITFTITNPNGVGLTGIAFNDTLPAGLVVANPPNAGAGTCTATFTPNAGDTSLSVSSIALGAAQNCTVKVDVKGTAAGNQSNTTGPINSVEGGMGSGSNTATVNVVAPPTIAKAFGAANIPLNGTTSLTFTITNPAANTGSETGVAFSDTLPSGLTTPNTAGSTACGTGTLVITGNNAISLTGGTVAVNTPCSIVLTVTGTTEGQKNNTTSAVTSTNGGTGNTAMATVSVAAPPTISKAFAPTQIPLNFPTTLTFTITNPNSVSTLNGISFNDSLPAGLVAGSVNSNNCGGSAGASGGSVSLSGGTLTAGTMCAVAVTITGTTAGVKNNSVTVNSTEGGLGNTSNASVTVVAPPTITKAFSAASIALSGTATITFTIMNPNGTVGLTGIAFGDTLPTGLVVANTPNVNNACGGSVTATGGAGSISLSGGGTLAANGSCTLKVDVTGTTAGSKLNNTGPISSTEGGTGLASNPATMTVVAPPVIGKVFGAAAIPVNASTTLKFTITNPGANVDAENGVAFLDTLPTGLTVANNPGVVSNCGGTVTAAANSGSISLTGGSIGVNSNCSITVNVTGTTSGVKINTTGNVTSTNGGTGNTATANLTVATPPTITKGFSPTSIFLNGISTLSFSINNSNIGLALTGVQFSDSLPAGVQVASPTGASNTCGGTFNPAPGDTSLSVTGGTVASNSSCAISVSVIGASAGTKPNTTGVISSNESGPGVASNTATLTVVAPAVISKAFAPTSLQVNGSSTLTFNIVNPAANTVAENGLAFTDTLPSGLVVSNTPNATNNCGGTLTAAAGTGSVSLANGTLAINSSCSITVSVTASSGGAKNNVTGNVSSTNGGPGNTASATLTVATQITVNTSPDGRSFSVDGTTYTSAQNLAWAVPSTHTLSTTALQVGTPGTLYVFTNWSDGGAVSHSVIAPAGPATYTANFKTQYELTTLESPEAGGAVDPGPGNFFDAGSTVNVVAHAAACYTFINWTGPVASASNASTTVLMSGPQTITANFTFTGGSGCGGGGGGRPTLALFATPLAGGTIVATPGPDSNNSYDPGASVLIKAQANAGYLFLGFSGDLNGSANPQTLLMNGSKTVFANFVKIPDNPEDFDFGVQKGNPLPGPQFVLFDGVLFGVFPASGGNWLLAAVTDGSSSAAPRTAATTGSKLQLSLNASVVNALGEGTYTSYVVLGSFAAPRVIRVRLFIDTLQINQVTDSAGYRPLLISPDGLFTAFGINLSNQKVQASVLPLGALLGGSSVTITDSAGVTRPGLLLYAAPDQVNLLSPPGLATGAATLTITNWAGLSGSFTVQAGNVAPGLFSADATGKGPAAAVVLKVAADGARTSPPAADCQSTPGKCVTVPIDLGGPNDSAFLSLYGTGIRGRTTTSNVSVTIGGLAVDTLYADVQSQYPGLDQINVQLPRALAGRGEVDVVVNVDGIAANVVRIAIQ